MTYFPSNATDNCIAGKLIAFAVILPLHWIVFRTVKDKLINWISFLHMRILVLVEALLGGHACWRLWLVQLVRLGIGKCLGGGEHKAFATTSSAVPVPCSNLIILFYFIDASTLCGWGNNISTSQFAWCDLSFFCETSSRSFAICCLQLCTVLTL